MIFQKCDYLKPAWTGFYAGFVIFEMMPALLGQFILFSNYRKPYIPRSSPLSTTWCLNTHYNMWMSVGQIQSPVNR